jgi:hypothetical protein
MLRQDGERRRAEVATLFEELSEFRAELRAYCADLRQLVWGDAATVPLALETAPEAALAAKLDSSVAAILAETPVPTKSERVEATGASPIARVIEPKVAVKSPVVEASTAAVSEYIKAVAPQPELQPASLEESIYTYLHEMQGAHLTDIESALGISRYQTVDTLRALIRKGLVTQRDRMYLIQEVNL